MMTKDNQGCTHKTERGTQTQLILLPNTLKNHIVSLMPSVVLVSQGLISAHFKNAVGLSIVT